jgi:hypothetical protein
MFTARPSIVVDAGGRQLTVERLAQLMTSIKGIPLTQEGARFLVDLWVDATLFGQALTSGRDLADSAIAVQVLWPDLAEAVGTRWHDSLTARRTPVAPDAPDSIYRADAVRVLQHILVRVQPNADATTRAAARHKIDQALARLRSGATFSRLAEELSDDPNSKAAGGFLPAAAKGQYVRAFDSAGWALAPGAMTGVVETQFGFHIIRRPLASEVGDRLRTFAESHFGQQLDSLYLDSLGIKKHLTISRSAPAAMREALADLEGARHSSTALARYDGGALTVADFLRWVTALGPGWVTDLSTRPDSGLSQFARVIAQNKLLLAQADSAGIVVAPETWASMLAQYRGQLDTLRASLGIAREDLTDPSASPDERARAVALKLETFWDQVASGRVRPRPLPGPLSAILRTEAKISVNTAAIERSLEIARDLKAWADSADATPRQGKSRGQAPSAPPGTAPAPGGR